MDAQEGRDMATVDIPGAFMQADPNEVLYMKLEGHMAEMLVKLNPQIYHRHIQTKGGKPILYVVLEKGSVWNFSSCISISEISELMPTRLGICHQPI
jgi:hypothetical protein